MLNESQFLWKLSKQKMSQNTCEFLVKSTEKCSAKKNTGHFKLQSNQTFQVNSIGLTDHDLISQYTYTCTDYYTNKSITRFHSNLQ